MANVKRITLLVGVSSIEVVLFNIGIYYSFAGQLAIKQSLGKQLVLIRAGRKSYPVSLNEVAKFLFRRAVLGTNPHSFPSQTP